MYACMKITAAATLAAMLACPMARADDAPIPAGKARVRVRTEPSPQGYAALLVALDGQPFHGESPLILDPGHHTLRMRCFIQGKTTLSDLAFGEAPQEYYVDTDFPIDMPAQHEYRSDEDAPESKGQPCRPYIYDSTNDRDADAEIVQVEPLAGSYGSWHKFAALENGGHYIHDSLPSEQYRQQVGHIGTLSPDVAFQRSGWLQMFETESWITATFAGKAADFYQKLADGEKQSCPSAQITVLSHSDSDVLYDLESGADCPHPRSIIGRFFTGPYDVHEVVIYSRVPLQDAEKTAWIDVLKSATTKEDN